MKGGRLQSLTPAIWWRQSERSEANHQICSHFAGWLCLGRWTRSSAASRTWGVGEARGECYLSPKQGGTVVGIRRNITSHQNRRLATLAGTILDGDMIAKDRKESYSSVRDVMDDTEYSGRMRCKLVMFLSKARGSTPVLHRPPLASSRISCS